MEAECSLMSLLQLVTSVAGVDQCLHALCRSQEIDMFGEISGVCFSPQADKFFVGIADATYSSLLQFNRHTYQSFLGGL